MTNEYRQQMMAGQIYARTPAYQRSLAFAHSGVEAMLRASPRSYVSISFGKQSLCVAHMVWEAAPDTPMYFLASDETWHMYDYRNVIDDFCSRWPINLHIVQTSHFFGAQTWKESRDQGDMDLQKMCPREDWDGWFWGLAKDESIARRITCSADNSGIHESIYRYADGKLRCTPIQGWGVRDLAAYITDHDIPLLNIYRKYGLTMRTTARITKKARDFGSSTLLRATNSKGYRALANEHQEVE